MQRESQETKSLICSVLVPVITLGERDGNVRGCHCGIDANYNDGVGNAAVSPLIDSHTRKEPNTRVPYCNVRRIAVHWKTSVVAIDDCLFGLAQRQSTPFKLTVFSSQMLAEFHPILSQRI